MAIVEHLASHIFYAHFYAVVLENIIIKVFIFYFIFILEHSY